MVTLYDVYCMIEFLIHITFQLKCHYLFDRGHYYMEVIDVILDVCSRCLIKYEIEIINDKSKSNSFSILRHESCIHTNNTYF